ncbi:MAG: hypothetical protein QG596_1576 [Actinomycetota bacterium]|nr:hypothetical protein [Actinomycetota bacterium]
MESILPIVSPRRGFVVRAIIALASVCLLALVLAGSASALTFSPPAFVPAGTQPHSVTTADFNADGNADIASANIYSDNVSIHLGDGVGGFLPGLFFPVGQNPEVIINDDFNGDGFVDLATANITSNNVSVLLGAGDGSFDPAADFAVDTGPHSLVSADFDGDGNRDIATVSVYNDTVSILLGDGSGGFSPVTFFPIQPGAFSPSITTADFNNDGNPDLATANYQGGMLSVLFGDGSGAFGPSMDIGVSPALGPFAVATADLNGDGKQDLVSANYTSGSLSVLLGDGDGGFSPPIDFGTGPGANPNLVIVADMNGDSFPDLIAPIYNTDSLVVLPGDGTGNFGAPDTFSVGGSTYPVSVATADFNGDGLPDLATANFLPNYLSVLLNTSPPPPVADLVIEKTAPHPSYGPGDVFHYTIVVRNTGNALAQNVVITDTLPAGLTYVAHHSNEADCSESAGTLTCGYIWDLHPGQEIRILLRVEVDPVAAAVSSEAAHLLDVQKVETQVDLDPGQQRTVQAVCPSGYFVSDGSVRIDHIDQGTGDWTAPQVLESRASSLDTWQGTVKNTAAGRAQAKIFAVCIKKATEIADGHTHNIIVSPPVTRTDTVPAGVHEAELQCGPGQVATQPGFTSSVPGVLTYSQPSGDGWKFALEFEQNALVTFSIACMSRQVSQNGGHGHNLGFQRIRNEITIQPGQVNEAQLTCPDGSKGVVGGWDLDHGLVSLGNDPRPVTRAFRIYNPSDHPLTARISLLCLGSMTAGESVPTEIVNTAYVSTSTHEDEVGNNQSSHTIAVAGTSDTDPIPEPDPVKPTPNNPIAGTIVGKGVTYSAGGVTFDLNCLGACGGTAKLTSIKGIKVGGKKFARGTLLAKGHYFIGRAGTKRIKLTLTRAGRKAISKGKAKKAVLRISGGSRRVVRVGRR